MAAKVRIKNDIILFFDLYTGDDQQPEDLSDIVNLSVQLKADVFGHVIIPIFSVTGNRIRIDVPAELQSVRGMYTLIVSYNRPNPEGTPPLNTFTIDQPAFELVARSIEAEPGAEGEPTVQTIQLNGVIGVAGPVGPIGPKGETGDDAYEVWAMQPGNEGKTIEDYFIFLQNPAYEAGITAVGAAGIALGAQQASEEAQAGSVAAMEKSDDFSNEAEDVEVEAGKFSSKHFSIKSGKSANLSQKWANEAKDVPVEGGEFSAKHYSLKAAAEKQEAVSAKVGAELAAQTSTTKAQEAAASAAAFPAVYPLIGYKSRVDADLGNIFALDKLTELYIKNLQLLPNTVFLWSGVSGMKTRTSGSNVFASKLYNMANKVQQFGAELVTNGTFTTDTSGWLAASGGILSVDTQRLKITNPASAAGGAYQAITTVIGKVYYLTFTFTYVDVNGFVIIGTTIGGSQLGNSGDLTANTTKTISFTATTTTTYITFGSTVGTTSLSTIWDNISVKQMDWVDGTNDAVQTTEANQPYVGGVIAPNEVRKLKSYAGNVNSLSFSSAFSFAANDDRTFTIVADIDRYSADDPFFTFSTIGNTNYFNLSKTSVRYAIANNYTSTAQRLSTYKKCLISVVYRSGNVSIYENGLLLASSTITANQVIFNQIAKLYAANGYVLEFFQLFNKALSASEVQAQHEYLRLQIPEIEGIAIGNQYWATSNYEGVVAGDGSVIPEVRNSDNTVTIDNTFDNDTQGWGGVRSTASWNSIDKCLTCTSTTTTGSGYTIRRAGLTVGKTYKVTFKARRVSGTLTGNPTLGFGYINRGVISNPTISSTFQEYIFYGRASESQPEINSSDSAVSIGDVTEFDDIKIEEVGWSQSTALYDAVYAQTSGTAAVKELAALKAAAMWCHYNNDVNSGAIYGKLYNWYAVKLISYYPPKGWRVPDNADYNQLRTYLGGESVAGSKIKALNGVFNNSFSTNESGFSAIAGGRRTDLLYANIVDYAAFYSSIALTDTIASKWVVFKNSSSFTQGFFGGSSTIEKYSGLSLRLLRNEPVGPNERMETSGVFDTNIASTAKQVPISFGYTVDCIRITNLQPSGGTNLTSVEAKLHNAAGTAIATLITGKTVNVASTMVYNISAEHAAMLQDGTVRVTATGNLAPGMIIEVVLKKATF